MGDYLSERLEQDKEVFVVTFPFYHVFSIVFQVLMAMQLGSKILLYPWVRDFDALKKILLKKEFTVFVGVHTLYKMLLQDAEITSQTFPQAKIFVAGAEHVQPITKQRWKAATGHLIVEGYGLTETSALAVMSSLKEEDNDLDAIGLSLPQTDIMLLGDNNEPITESDTPGEICIRGPQVVEGYWNRPEENKVSFVDGWLRTGDIGIRKPNGQYKLLDRKKDMINVSGFNVYPNEVEAVLMSYPGISDCAAVAIPDEKSGERVVAFFVAAQDIDVMALQCFCRERLSAYKVPVKFLEVDRIPKSPVGKTLRAELRASLLNNNVFNAV
jgi:long-chain acyl-CoA synthetase